MYAFAVVQKDTFAVLYAYLIYIGLQRMDFVAAKKQAFFFQVKAQNFFHHPFAGGQRGDFDMLFARAALKCLMSLWSLRFGQVEQIEMVVTVPLTLINKLGTVPWQEQQAVHRFHVFGMLLFVYHTLLFARSRIVTNQFRMVLVAVQFNHVYFPVIRAPGNVREITVGGISCLQPYRPACGRRKDTHRHFVHFFSCHRIFARISGGYACRDIHLRIVGHHTLVHPIESELFPVRTPECSFGNAELVTMYGFSIHQVVATIGRHGHRLPLFRRDI